MFLNKNMKNIYYLIDKVYDLNQIPKITYYIKIKDSMELSMEHSMEHSMNHSMEHSNLNHL